MSFFESIPRPVKTYHSTTYDRISKIHGFNGTGKTVLITGGATGVGYSISKAFASAGVARVVIVSRTPGPQEKAKAELEASNPSTQVILYQASITDGDRMSNILLGLGTIDILVLCAAIYPRRAPATQLSTQEISDSFSTNVIAPFALAKEYLGLPLPTTGRKTIIHISSAASQMRAPLRSAYGPGKAAITQVMQHLAFEHKDEANVFSIHPGAFYTPSSAEIYPEDSMKWEDIELPGHFVRWLAGSESGFLSGRFLWAQWDIDELVALKEKFLENQSLSTIGLVL
ncbi:putative NADP(+)-dependent dehydrogenase [Viridothelium virens]|uniref:Putative NADP(+)-dependent dehydrogenase n=1 Tax=Viridothelium virens TaxID=1048519 RepID=A0A6A6H574_VIRVR|nr:putative NADP(+)-dependent dehydrogenase [Viridothelium virens]